MCLSPDCQYQNKVPLVKDSLEKVGIGIVMENNPNMYIEWLGQP